MLYLEWREVIEMNVEVNYIAILIAAIVSMALGFLWYSPALFGKRWMKLMGYTSESMKAAQKEMGKMYIVSLVLTLITAYVLSHIIALSTNFYNYNPLMTGLTSAFWVWIGFIMPVQATEVIFGKKTWELFGINTGYQLASVLAMGIVIGFF